jgi:PKD repeat protein
VLVIWCVVVFVFGTIQSISQSPAAWNWYFGQRAGVTFRSGTIAPLSDSRMVANRSSASISDPTTGELLFYTDGITVWNRFHEVMPNGTGLMGDPSTSQGALIVPAPGRPNLYYLFNSAPTSAPDASSRCLCLYYSIIDMRAAGGLGDVTKKNELALSDITEHLTATLDCRGEGWWIITRSRLSRHFYSLHLTAAYLESQPIVSSVGNPQLDVRDAGQMHVSPDNQYLVMTSTAGNTQLFDFDGQTGRISGGVNLFALESFGKHYGVAFSPDSRKVFVAVTDANDDGTTQIYRFDISRGTPQQITASMSIVADLSSTSSWVPIQRGPDGKIYIGIPGTSRLSMIERPNSEPPLLGFVPEAILTTGTIRMGLPNMPAPLLIDPSERQISCSVPRASFTMPSVVCELQPIGITDKSTGTIEAWEWTIEGGLPSVSIERSPSRVVFPQTGVYTVQLVVRGAYGADTAVSTITVQPRPNLTVDSLVRACPGTPRTYRWTPSSSLDDPTSSSPTARVRTTTMFTVVGSDPSGCHDTATVLVRIPNVSAGPDVTICAGATAQLRASGGSSYRWRPSVGLSDSTSETPIANPTTTTTYFVDITSDGCLITDTVKVVVLDSLDPAIDGITTSCAGDTVLLTSSAGTSFEWSGSGVLDRYSPSTRVVVSSMPTRILLRVRSGMCTAIDSIDVSPLPMPTIRLEPVGPICRGDQTTLRATSSESRLRWIPSAGLDVDTGNVVVASPLITTTYRVVAENELGCRTVDSVRVVVLPSPIINAGADLSICAGSGKRLLASGFGDEFSWTPTDGLSDPTILAPVATPTATTTYTLRARIGSCEYIDSVTVYVSRLQVRASGDTTACRGSAIQLRASGAWQYRWTPSTGLKDSTAAVQTIVADTSITYYVTGVDGLGCTQTQAVSIVVRDTVPIRLISGSVTATAGLDSIGIPVFLEVPPQFLPLRIDEMRATLIHDASTFFPITTDRGSLRVSIRGSQRMAHLRINDLEVISPSQLITSVRGTILAGNSVNDNLMWENIEWTAGRCPNVTTISGVLYVTGCNILARLLRTYTKPSIGVSVRPTQHSIELDIQATMPGPYEYRLLSVDGRTVHHQKEIVQSPESATLRRILDMSEIGSGIYHLVTVTPMGASTVPVVWIP